MNKSLPYDEFEMWHGHPDLYMNNLEVFKNTPDDSDIAYFVQVFSKYPENIKEKTKNSHLLLKTKFFLKINILIL